MIETLYGSDQLVGQAGAKTFFLSLVIGLAFGFALERAGFGSSRRLAGIFYFRDMTVLKVMFTALITAMLGLQLCIGMGWLDPVNQLHLLPTVYGAQIIGGLLFGVGFVISGWCPGTAAVGMASGRGDAVVFLGGSVLGAILYNETYPMLGWLARWGEQAEPQWAFGMAPATFGFLFTLAAVGAFYAAELTEKVVAGTGRYLTSPFLRAFSLALIVFAAALFLFPERPHAGTVAGTAGGPARDATVGAGSISAQQLLETIEAEEDHFEPETLADRLMHGDPSLILVDVRSAAEYAAFHIRGAIHVPLSGLLQALEPHRGAAAIVLYSHGMTHPAQARDVLAQAGFTNAYLLTGGLEGFVNWCLKPVSLRDPPLPPDQAERVRAWRTFFLGDEAVLPLFASQEKVPVASLPDAFSGLLTTAWLEEHLGRDDVRIIDCRTQPEYSPAHLPGAVCLYHESFRGSVGGLPTMILPGELLAAKLSLMGIRPTDTIVLVAGDSVRDACVIGLGLARVGHPRWGILEGGIGAWGAEQRPLTTALPSVTPSVYPVPPPDKFIVDYRWVQSRVGDGKTVILDSRPADYFSGTKSDEARPGHIPGAINRPFSEDLGEDKQLKPRDELAAIYAALLPDRNAPILIHCRTGHQAAQTYFVVKRVLGYPHVWFYDGGWSEWAARPELPAE
jgi:thiosulfate/3-mercaptopyruvate sulfurtransferase